MSIIANNLLQGDEGYNLTRSLRFRSSASATLSKNWGSNGSSQTFTISAWVKRGVLGSIQDIVTARQDGNNNLSFRFIANDTLEVYGFVGGSSVMNLVTTQVFRDPSAWYHFVFAVDTTQATSSNRVKFYVNGTQITAFGTANYPAQNATTLWSQTAATHYFGTYNASSELIDGYMAEINVTDGSQQAVTAFGSFNALTGVWQPAKYTGTYGTNGFYLPFTDTTSTTTLGYDFSGNSNNWTTNNLSLTTGSTYDSMNDVPTLTSATTANYCVLNPLDKYSNVTLSNANLSATFSAYTGFVRGTFAIPSTGKWYWEGTVPTSDVRAEFGIATFSQALGVDPQGAAGCWFYYSNGTNTYKYSAGTGTLWGSAWVSGDIIGIAFDATAGTISYYINGALQGGGVATTGLTGTYAPMVGFGNNTSTAISVNFGQRPFSYTPPTGFVALNTFNLPEPSIKAGNKHMDATLYTGNGGTQSIVNSGGFQPDFIWEKARSDAFSHMLYNSVSGAGKYLRTNLTSAEVTDATTLTSFNSNGFTVGAGDNGNNSGTNAVAWQWKAGNSAGSSNTAGSITSTVSANPTAGFSVVTYTGTGTNGASIGHGLGVTPAMVIMKTRSAVDGWVTYHQSIPSPTSNYLVLNTTAATAVASGFCTPSSSTITFTTSYGGTNGSGVNLVAYCFAPVAGYSAFGSYAGNSSSDGAFIYTGFKPKYILIKNISNGTTDWYIFDSSRNTYNVANSVLNANLSSAELTGGDIDILSNGFKPRVSATATNKTGDTYIYYAVAENPFKYSLGR